jgi:hypothetical protein
MRQHTSTNNGPAPPRAQRDTEAPRTTAEPEATRREREREALWAMTPAQRVAAMWRSELTLQQLAHWSSHAPREVPLLGDEFAWIAMRTPEWTEAAKQHQRAA